ncbi:MAG TPA: Hsp20/alpha crystallin family protein [Geobacteraceae bacterium]
MGHILSTLGEMERFMENAFRRPFLGAWPLRGLFHEGGSFGEMTPNIDIYEHGNEVVLKADLPGIKRDDISVKAIGNNITISGERKEEEKVEKKDYLRFERNYGAFSRTMTLPEGCDTGKIKASFKDGVLEVHVPRLAGGGGVKQIKVE